MGFVWIAKSALAFIQITFEYVHAFLSAYSCVSTFLFFCRLYLYILPGCNFAQPRQLIQLVMTGFQREFRKFTINQILSGEISPAPRFIHLLVHHVSPASLLIRISTTRLASNVYMRVRPPGKETRFLLNNTARVGVSSCARDEKLG